jgi:hypothetical protein
MKKLASAGMKLLEEVLLISLQFGYQPLFGLEQFRGQWHFANGVDQLPVTKTPSN